MKSNITARECAHVSANRVLPFSNKFFCNAFFDGEADGALATYDHGDELQQCKWQTKLADLNHLTAALD